MKVAMLTTIDNPYNPFDSFKEWMMWDLRAGYNSPGLLARIAKNSSDLSEADQEVENENAIDEILAINATGMHRKVVREIELT
jgi:hypothetical protein